MVCSAILLSAGKGSRYKGTKQDVLFHGKQLWRYAYEAALEVVDREHIVAVGKDIPGGETRTGSVMQGLLSLPADTERVIILEAARPMVTVAQIRELLDDEHPSTTFVYIILYKVCPLHTLINPHPQSTVQPLSYPRCRGWVDEARPIHKHT